MTTLGTSHTENIRETIITYVKEFQNRKVEERPLIMAIRFELNQAVSGVLNPFKLVGKVSIQRATMKRATTLPFPFK